MSASLLKNCTIVVTRPSGLADELIRQLHNLGANVVHFPVLAISAAANSAQTLAQAKDLASYDMAIFISRNAAIFGAALVKQAGDWPPDTLIAAIGEGTAQQLHKLGIAADIVAQGTANTESLLSTPGMDTISGKRILIFRGNGGKEKLASNLRMRGATVDYLECYERKRPQCDPEILSDLWHRKVLNGIILTSSEGLTNLYQMVKKEDLIHLNTTPLYVISSTMVELSGKLGYKLTPILVPSAANEDVIQSVLENCRSKIQL